MKIGHKAGFFALKNLFKGTGKEKKKKERERMVALIVSILAILAENNCLTEEVYLAVTFSKIWIDIYNNINIV